MGLFGKSDKSVGKSEPFVALIRVAQEDVQLKNHLLAILSQNRFNRESILNSYINELAFKKAPQQFIVAIACLLDDGIAKKALEILKGHDPDSTE